MCWVPRRLSHRFSCESHFDEIAALMNRHAVFVDVASFQINFIAAYPATIGVVELGHRKLL